METINNIASSASKLIYGDNPANQSGQEPVSGVGGRGTAAEPYDSGNLEGNPDMSGKSAQATHGDIGATTGSSDLSGTAGGSGLVDRTKNFGESGDSHFEGGRGTAGVTGTDSSIGGRTSDNPGGSSTTGTTGSTLGSSNPTGTTGSTLGGTSTTDTTGSSTLGGSTGTSAAQGVNVVGAIRPEHQTDKTGVTSLHSNDPHGSDVRPTERDTATSTANIGGFGTAESSVGADPASAQKPIQKQQGGDKPTAQPTSAYETEAIKDKKDEGEAALAKRDPNDHSGEPLKVHDGSEKRPSMSGGLPGGDDEHKSQASHGTGEQHVKTSGFKADGGDFDASLPGAGREADRLLEQKGVHKSGPTAGEELSPSPPAEGGEKPSLGTKIKEKLHIGKHKSDE